MFVLHFSPLRLPLPPAAAQSKGVLAVIVLHRMLSLPMPIQCQNLHPFAQLASQYVNSDTVLKYACMSPLRNNCLRRKFCPRYSTPSTLDETPRCLACSFSPGGEDQRSDQHIRNP
ncbi:unnamed protein product [Choristocarpus tenellus]